MRALIKFESALMRSSIGGPGGGAGGAKEGAVAPRTRRGLPIFSFMLFSASKSKSISRPLIKSLSELQIADNVSSLKIGAYKEDKIR
jgi:hypothetical protein